MFNRVNKEWKLYYKIGRHTRSVRSIRFDKNGTQMYTAGADRRLRCYDLEHEHETWKTLRKWHAGPVERLMLIDSGNGIDSYPFLKNTSTVYSNTALRGTLVAGDTYGVICAYDVRNPKSPSLRFEEDGHTDYISDLLFLGDTRNVVTQKGPSLQYIMASSSGDGTVGLFDLRRAGKALGFTQALKSRQADIVAMDWDIGAGGVDSLVHCALSNGCLCSWSVSDLTTSVDEPRRRKCCGSGLSCLHVIKEVAPKATRLQRSRALVGTEEAKLCCLGLQPYMEISTETIHEADSGGGIHCFALSYSSEICVMACDEDINFVDVSRFLQTTLTDSADTVCESGNQVGEDSTTFPANEIYGTHKHEPIEDESYDRSTGAVRISCETAKTSKQSKKNDDFFSQLE